MNTIYYDGIHTFFIPYQMRKNQEPWNILEEFKRDWVKLSKGNLSFPDEFGDVVSCSTCGEWHHTLLTLSEIENKIVKYPRVKTFPSKWFK